MKTYLRSLQPGTTFETLTEPVQTGVLIKVNECRARVRIHQPAQLVDFDAADGRHRQFVCESGRLLDWAPSTEVEA